MSKGVEGREDKRDLREIDHCLMTFVTWDGQWRRGVVDDVDIVAPVREVLLHP